ncbi:uncharacterized protein LOC128076048 isoform X1 [Tympanuchus pallidicinctus]|uniref:uncharacterized protein LOC128076048 isoform X1 n=1 Tax=Tympanuchus pallidicinctus TaxID=109042 RepID=UPI002286EE78|nr:uncharacterized protein LOC128076048 isoform X1 [Tympanuchus pallidicinctus]XP_052529298.1 uncharacterized protein LOC128076048 isoform X2 [Tympanuchus pallidicinctus]XP_052529299.1 uncharacterized protein LOC128076048 isoform X1 [Tympanuchus pallidicinctus]
MASGRGAAQASQRPGCGCGPTEAHVLAAALGIAAGVPTGRPGSAGSPVFFCRASLCSAPCSSVGSPVPPTPPCAGHPRLGTALSRPPVLVKSFHLKHVLYHQGAALVQQCPSSGTPFLFLELLVPTVPQGGSAPMSGLASTFSSHLLLKNRRMAWVGKAHSDHLLSTPCCVQGRQPADQAAQSHVQPGLECLQGWGIHSLLGQPVPVPHLPLCDKLPPQIQPKPPLCQLKTTPCPVTIHPINSHSPSCLYAPFEYWKATIKSPWILLQAKQALFLQPFFMGELLQPSGHHSARPPFLCPPWKVVPTACLWFSVPSRQKCNTCEQSAWSCSQVFYSKT